jgi:uncharacterized membrane protein YoaK (UPF0700 family)
MSTDELTATGAAPPALGRMSQEDTRVVLLVVLTGVTGSVDAASYLGTGHVFTANMTGNVALLGLAAGGAALPLLRSALALTAFVGGTVIGGRLIGRKEATSTWPRAVLLGQSISLFCLLAAAVSWLRADAPKDVLAALLALAMGLQGAAVRSLGVADLPTTVVTSTLTGLGADSWLAGGPSTRWRRRLAAVTALLVGALLGALLFRVAAPLALLPALVAYVGVFVAVWIKGLHRESAGRVDGPAG